MKKLSILKYWQEVLFIYFVQLILGLFIGKKAFSILKDKMGNSLILDDMNTGFDRTVVTDLLNTFSNFKEEISPTIIGAMVLWAVLSILFNGGLVYNISQGRKGVSNMLRGGFQKWGFNFIISILSHVLLLVIAGGFALLVFKLLGNPQQDYRTELPFVWSIIGILIFSIVVGIAVWSWSVLSRMFVSKDYSLGKSIAMGWKQLKFRLGRFYVIGLGALVLNLIISIIVSLILDDVGAENWLVVFFVIVIPQLAAIVRLWIRLEAYYFTIQSSMEYRKFNPDI